MIDVTGKDPALILSALYNHSRPLGLGHLHHKAGEMSVEQAADLLDRGKEHARNGGVHFAYLHGRVMHVLIPLDTSEGASLDPYGYDLDNGDGAAARAIAGEDAIKPSPNPLVQQGYAPVTCTMPADLAMLLLLTEVAKGRSPCWGCNDDRTMCKGEAKRARW